MRWVYHPERDPEVVSDEEAEKRYQQGWYDTPAKFPPKPQPKPRRKRAKA